MMGTPVAEKDPRAQECIRRWAELKTDRSRFESDWEDIARLIRPQRGGFGLLDASKRVLEKPLSSEPIIAQSSFAAGIYSALTNPANRWAGLETPDRDLNNWKPMAEWNDMATRLVLNSFRPEISGFYSATFQAYSDLAAFGNAGGYDEIDEGNRRFIDVTLSLAEFVWDIDAHGRVVEVIRKFHLTPRQARAMFEGKGNLPAKIIEMEEKGRTEKLPFYQHVLRNYGFQKGRFGAKGKAWLSLYVCEVDEALIRVAGYDEMPFYVPRWDVDSGFTVGTGPGFIALPASRVLHLMEAATIRAAQRAADPTLLAPSREDWPLNGRAVPGHTVYGGMNIRGQRMVDVLGTTGQVGLTQSEKQAKVEEIAKAFHYAIMPMQNRTGITTEETRIIEEANLRNWAPHADRIMEEYAARKVERRFRLLWKAGQIPPPPKEAEGVPLQVRYQSAATMALRAREGLAVRQYLMDLGPLAQMGPRHLDRINGRLDTDALMEALHDASPSLPASILRGRDEADQIAEAEAQQRQMLQMAAAAPGLAKAAKDGGEAMAMMGGDSAGMMGGGM
jgi:hypothetical protein